MPNEDRPCRLCRRPKSEHGQARYFESEEDMTPFECNEVWRDPGSFTAVFVSRDEVFVECEDCWAVLRAGRQDRHAEWHERLKWSTSPHGGILTAFFGGGV